MQNTGRVSMADVATAAGVSLSTVSRALSGRGDLPAETRSGSRSWLEELGYQRSPTPRGRPSTTDPRMIELVLGVFDDPWTDEVASGARSAAADSVTTSSSPPNVTTLLTTGLRAPLPGSRLASSSV